jgi:hypothetical protein
LAATDCEAWRFSSSALARTTERGVRSSWEASATKARRYVALSNVPRSLIDRRTSPMDLIAGSQQLSRNARRLHPKRGRRLRVVR